MMQWEKKKVEEEIAKAKRETAREILKELKNKAYPFPCAIGVEYAVPFCKIDELAEQYGVEVE